MAQLPIYGMSYVGIVSRDTHARVLFVWHFDALLECDLIENFEPRGKSKEILQDSLRQYDLRGSLQYDVILCVQQMLPSIAPRNDPRSLCA